MSTERLRRTCGDSAGHAPGEAGEAQSGLMSFSTRPGPERA
ncbi:MAG: hypothetical protein ACLFV4_01065 [Candidatus Hydrogenedentota bacterium]